MHSIKRLVAYLRPYKKWMIIGPLLMTIEVVMDLLQPKLMERIIDVGIAQLDMSVVGLTGLSMVGVAFVGALGGVLNTIVAVRVAQGLGADLRGDLFRKVQNLSFGNLDKLRTGELITRLTNDVTQIQQVLMLILRMMVRSPLTMIGSIVMAVLTSPRLSLLIVGLTPFIVVLIIIVMKRAHPLFSAMQAKLDDLNGVMQENLAGARVVKAFVRAEHEEQRFGEANEALRDTAVRAIKLMSTVMPTMMLLINLGVVGIVWFGGVQVIQGDMQVGQITAFVNYLLRSLSSMMMASMLLNRVSRAQASAERIAGVLESEPEIGEPDEPAILDSPRGHVVFERVSFGYDSRDHNGQDGDEHLVLNDVSFEAKPGQTVAILGATGSGKSSLVYLIPRFYDVGSGSVWIDGVDVRNLDKHDLRRNVAIALQEPVLFSGSMADNIRYGRPDASDEEVVEAAKAAQVHEFIQSLPAGYNSHLGQRGVNVSGGQKQRIAIARALLTQPSVLILDDSTSSVDVETEARIQEALEEVKANCTTFIIAQRISTVLTADKILVLEDGRIVAEGTHEELMEESKVYREIYESQLGSGVMVNA